MINKLLLSKNRDVNYRSELQNIFNNELGITYRAGNSEYIDSWVTEYEREWIRLNPVEYIDESAGQDIHIAEESKRSLQGSKKDPILSVA